MKIGAETKKDRIIGLPEMIIMITTIAIPIHRRFKLLRQRASKLRKAKTDQPTNERTNVRLKTQKRFFNLRIRSDHSKILKSLTIFF